MSEKPPGTPPSDDRIEAANRLERRFLGGCLRDGEAAADVAWSVRPEDFRSDPHRWVFRAIRNLVEGRAPVEPTSVAGEILARGWKGHLGGNQVYPFLAELYDQEIDGARLEWYAAQLRHAGVKRHLYVVGHRIVRLAEGGMPADEAMAEAEKEVLGVAEERLAVGEEERSAAEIVPEVWERIDRRGKGSSGTVPTGLEHLDDVLVGLQPSETIVVAARPSVGKTTVGMAFALNATLKQGKAALFVSLEQPGAELIERACCCLAGIDSTLLKQGRVSKEEAVRLQEAGDLLRQARLYVADKASQRVSAIASRARRLRRRGELDLLLVDYLQLVEPENRRDPRHEQVAQVSRGLKLLARELQVPVVVMAQLNREVERRAGEKPRLSDLRESGSIEADADVVLLLHRPAEDHARQSLEVGVAKNRNGQAGVDIMLRHDRRTGRVGGVGESAF